MRVMGSVPGGASTPRGTGIGSVPPGVVSLRGARSWPADFRCRSVVW
ncbi:hypothetical protein LY12_002450 [Prauserella alba]|nr:hypothetical protein [Prauserella alba]